MNNYAKKVFRFINKKAQRQYVSDGHDISFQPTEHTIDISFLKPRDPAMKTGAMP